MADSRRRLLLGRVRDQIESAGNVGVECQSDLLSSRCRGDEPNRKVMRGRLMKGAKRKVTNTAAKDTFAATNITWRR